MTEWWGITKVQFVRWLKARMKEGRRFRRGDQNYCPLAAYQREVLGVKDPEVIMAPTGWGNLFIDTYDEEGPTAALKAIEPLGRQ